MTDLTTHFNQYTPCEPVILRFYNKSRRCVKSIISTDVIYFGDHMSPYFRTATEYMIAIVNVLRDQNGQACTYSYIEVFDGNTFIIRHYVRSGVLSPLWSNEVDARLDPLLKERQIATKPYLNWSRIVHDTMFGRVDRDVSIGEFVERYRL